MNSKTVNRNQKVLHGPGVVNSDGQHIHVRWSATIENFFDTSKNDLGGGATYLRSDLHVIGYNFVTFLAFTIW